MIGIVIPVHNEEELLESCLRSTARASADLALSGEEVRTFVVLDACRDRSEEIARQFPVEIIESAARKVGFARARGTETALHEGARWIACTDADSEVPPDWLSRQCAWQTDVVCGTIRIGDWSEYPPGVPARFSRGYADRDGHRHIHGANLSFSADLYRRSSGFLPVAAHEDIALVREFEKLGAVIRWTNQPRVLTSGRRSGRAASGFASFLHQLARDRS